MAKSGGAVLDRPHTDDHVACSTVGHLPARLTAVVTELAAYLGRPLLVEGTRVDPPEIEVRLRTVTPDRSGWRTLTSLSRSPDADADAAALKAVVAAMTAVDPVAVLVWSLHRSGHIQAAVASVDGSPRPTVGPAEDVGRLERLTMTLTEDGRMGVRTSFGEYRALRCGTTSVALLLGAHPEASIASDTGLAALISRLSPWEAL